MPAARRHRRPPPALFTVAGVGGRRYVVYNARDLDAPGGHRPGGWYFQGYPIAPGFLVGDAYETAEAAARAARGGPAASSRSAS